jgi:putative copper resistance protein D
MWVDVLSVTLRALSFLALFQAAGIAIFLALLDHEPKGTVQTLRRLGTVSALVAALMLIGQYVLEAARMSGELGGAMDPTLQSLVMHSAASVALSWRLLGLLMIIAGLRSPSVARRSLAVVGMTILLASFTLVGHTSKDALRWLLSPLLFAHLFVVAFWFGALVPLYVVSSHEPAAIAGRIVERFSARAGWLVPGLLLAGILLATVLLPNVAALRTPYGHLLILKVVGFSTLMVFAAWNKWRLGPALGRGNVRAARLLRFSLAAEYALIASVLCVTAVLTMFYTPEG